jgi:hypothetical protein
VDALYFSVVTLTTVGYGDFAPQTDLGKLFTAVYVRLGIGILLCHNDRREDVADVAAPTVRGLTGTGWRRRHQPRRRLASALNAPLAGRIGWSRHGTGGARTGMTLRPEHPPVDALSNPASRSPEVSFQC